MKKIFLSIAFVCSISNAQKLEKFNLDFEQINASNQPKDWFKWGQPEVESVNTETQSQNKAVKITTKPGNEFGSIAYRIPNNYKGKTFRLEGYIKTKDVESFAGIILRLDDIEKQPIGFINSRNTPAIGTTEWTKYSVELPYDEKAENIYVAGIITGKGEAYFDNFKLYLDDKDIQTLNEERKLRSDITENELYKNSNINITDFSNENIENLATLARIWGFLKYYHPNVASGKYNWDYELFKFLPRYEATKTTSERNQVLQKWIDDLGKIEPCKKCHNVNDNRKLKPELSWINHSDFSNDLIKSLNNIYNNRAQGKQYYIDLEKGARNPSFTNEASYIKFTYPDQGYQLLTLYRYWNMINYFFPYKYATDKDWDSILVEYIPRFLKNTNELDFEKTTINLITEINDTHAFLKDGFDKYNEATGTNYPPIKAKFIEGKLIVTNLINLDQTQYPIKIGDEIQSINGKSIQELEKEFDHLIPASNESAKYRNLANKIMQSPTTTLQLKIENKEYSIPTISSNEFFQKSKESSYKILDHNIGYITLATILKSDLEQIQKQLFNTDGIIIDIRNYPNDIITHELAALFSSKAKPFVVFTKPNTDNYGEFSIMPPINTRSNTNAYKGQVIVLVNEDTQSNAEFTTMALQAGNNTKVIGSQTAGADGNVSYLTLPGGIKTSITGLGVYYPDNRETQRIGIVPDIEVKPTIQGIKQGKDEVLEKAIQIILNN